jgi:hypothetical protein
MSLPVALIMVTFKITSLDRSNSGHQFVKSAMLHTDSERGAKVSTLSTAIQKGQHSANLI